MERDGPLPSNERLVSPVIRDCLVMFSTIKGSPSYRSAAEGTPYISTLCDQLKSNAKDHDVVTILERVNRKMETFRCKEADNDEDFAQVPSFESSLSQKLYFDVCISFQND